MSFDLDLVLSFGPQILTALAITIALWVAGSGLGLVLGFFIAVARRYGGKPVDTLLMLPVELIRGTPFLVQIFLLYYGGPYVGLSLDKTVAGLLGLTVYGAAYYSELWRAGFDAIPKGHLEAADCVGLDRSQTMRRIILPEMTMLVLPSMVNMTILMLKETAILSIISVPELTLVVSAIGTEYYAFVESFTILALLYWGLVELCGAAGRHAERRLSKYRFSVS
ncbi:amino acid ABC transporter permease [Methylobrevis pamukkalensis]|uniref:Inner membrane amino-acid ABC transporter permease protein YecS n=1 Tax=Methylobrevis pamukkalensis TaxID=1439726 RepID=A0A1E3GZ93_9HYPH|nr:amino acid ABC transporter permease [Methylobrevis pamukkalensis]ODN69387.1 Inner membrane amino-acid ABC transporter permease protein YecS [Methylobrevis pamukkalensis]